jgi:uncharacterized protein
LKTPGKRTVERMRGNIYFWNGEPLAAWSSLHEGVQAVCDLLSLKQGILKATRPMNPPPFQNIRMDMQDILMSYAVNLDETHKQPAPSSNHPDHAETSSGSDAPKSNSPPAGEPPRTKDTALSAGPRPANKERYDNAASGQPAPRPEAAAPSSLNPERVNGNDSTPPGKDEETTGEKIKEALSEFLRIDGVTAAAVVGRDGFVLESVGKFTIEADALGAVVANAAGASEMIGKAFNMGQIEQSLAEFETGKAILTIKGDDILVLLTVAQAGIGSVRFAVKKGIEDLVKLL